ncbi:hypothetical protein PoB_006660300 [Plakobranchus ocellatus]|uniref:Uncharacterized protein n=1 Tax=Plakobranchus ocellatus TaxID=259542 RepID=A0AAV4D7E4_9GAST|nr:hypothetical protein PoB_006660300 [Plakobranchus ocellatus]
MEAVMREEDEFCENDETSKIFCNAIRKCVYFCLLSHVPVQAIGQVIKYIAECQGKDAIYVPHPSTISRCSYELGILSDIQCREFLNNAETLTLAWDATTLNLKGTHINQIVVSSKHRCMTLATDLLPGGASEDYTDHLVQTLINIVGIYAKFSGSDNLKMMTSIVQKFRCTMSDRASGNHCTAVRLMTKLDVKLLELNCQLHPLEAFASAARDALLEHEKHSSNHSQTFGQMAGAVNVIAAVSKLRFKDGKGDPTGFKSFLKSQKIDSRLLPRYVGNRLHIVFHLGGSIYYLRKPLLIYLKTQCSQQKLRVALIGDLSNELIVTHLQVLGLFGKVFTGPWMTEIYSSASERDHMGKTLKILSCLDFLGKVRDHPELLLATNEDGFGNRLPSDNVLRALKNTDSSSSTLEAITLVASKVHSRLERQLKKYRENPAYCPSDKAVQDYTASASVHNMVCERGLGRIDCFLRRAPNANIKTVDAKVRGHLNSTLEWLESSNSQHSILAFARKAGAVFRKASAKQKAAIEEKILKRQQEKGQLREMADRKKKEREVKKALEEDNLEKLLEGVDTECVTFVREVVNGVTGRLFQHLWSTSEGADDLYYATIKKFGKAKKECKVWVAYWKVEEGSSEDDAVDYQITMQSLITDIILGDVIV